MAQTIEEFQREFFRDVEITADASGRFKGEAFFEIVAGYLVAAGELETQERAMFNDRKGTRIDGHGGHPRDADGVLSIVVQDFVQTAEVETLGKLDMETAFRNLTRFVTRARDSRFRNSLEESAPAFEAALHIDGAWEFTRRIKMILISNRKLSSRIDGIASTELEGKEAIYSVWDLERIYRYVTSGREREDLELDLEADYGGTIPVLPAHLGVGDYEAFLAVIPGAQLARIYDRCGSRLLEQNVRSFLQLKGNVNKGMARTIREEPEMFFAYNNGITATAESVELKPDGLRVSKIRNLQIVNGGQTTASLHLQQTKGIDLSGIFVQMKLSIVKPERAEVVVPKISEYANTQNKVNAADFFANHPFHVELERSSRRLLAPAAEGTFYGTHWFYERSRGQYLNERSRLSGSAQKKFDADFPKYQMINKTDLAKALNLWPGYVEIDPGSVCRGAQKTFSDFANAVSRAWTDTSAESINDAFFRECVAKMIIFRESEKIVSKRPWYQNGYRAQIVAHGIARLAWELKSLGDSLAFEKIWSIQGLTAGLREAMTLSVDTVQYVITNPINKGQNISEWAKQPACWQQVKNLDLDLSSNFLSDLLSRVEADEQKKAARKDKRELSGIDAQTAVIKAGHKYWRSMLDWGLNLDLVTPSESRALEAASKPGFLPSEKHCIAAMQTQSKLVDAGFKDDH